MEPDIATLLLGQLLYTWYPDVKALAARTPNVLAKTPKLQQTPALVSILARLADAPRKAHEPEGKELPCGHRVDVRSILTHFNLFGNPARGKNRHSLVCPDPSCDVHYTLPSIPAPGTVDGLEARLDLIHYFWVHGKDAPNHVDVQMTRLLRRILDHIGHRPRSLDVSSSLPKQRRLTQTVRLLESEGAVAARMIYAGPTSLRGKEPYCKYRRSKARWPEYLQLKYLPPSPGQFCYCEEPHWLRNPRAWISSPAEDEEKREFAVIPKSRKAGKHRQKKSVRFAAPVITHIHYFERYSSGPCSRSIDTSSKMDDDKEIERLNFSRRGVSGWGTKDQTRLMMDNDRKLLKEWNLFRRYT